MRFATLDDLTSHDSLYLSAQAGDVALSCPARVAWERGHGLKVLVLTLFGPAGDGGPAEADHFHAGLSEAKRRHPEHGTFRSVVYGKRPEDDDSVDGSARLLEEVRRRVQPHHVYVPLGVGGHIDYRVAYEAALRTFEPGASRDVFFYEERPYASVPLAVRVRLGQIGARLPPAVVGVPRRSGRVRFLMGSHLARHAGAGFKGWIERLSCAGLAARQWREARAWSPRKALGPRLQPVFQAASAGPAERYWLLLPERLEGGLAAVPDDLIQPPTPGPSRGRSSARGPAAKEC